MFQFYASFGIGQFEDSKLLNSQSGVNWQRIDISMINHHRSGIFSNRI